MDLMQENPTQNNKSSGTKVALIIIVVLIILLLLSAVIIWMYTQKIQRDAFKVTIDGLYNEKASEDKSLFMVQEGKVYTSIEEICSYIGYMYYPGGYRQYTEDRTKCYVTNSKETVTFASGQKEIVKYAVNNSEPQTFEINEEIITVGEKLYISEDGLKKAFNLLMTYEAKNNSLTIATLPYLANYYEQAIENASLENSEFDDNTKFNNKKALLNNLIIVKDPETNLYGVSAIEENNQTVSIITARYAKIEYMEGEGDFVVTSTENKLGIIGRDGLTKVRLEFDKIEEIDKDLGLYLVTSGINQGVINRNGKVIVSQDYDSIGLNANSYDDKNITNRYILYGNLIPVRIGNKWGLIDKDGEKITQVEYDRIGCNNVTISGVRNANGIILVPEINGIVLGRNIIENGVTVEKYGIINSSGQLIADFILDSAYAVTMENKTNYYVISQNQTIDIVEYFREEMTQID